MRPKVFFASSECADGNTTKQVFHSLSVSPKAFAPKCFQNQLFQDQKQAVETLRTIGAKVWLFPYRHMKCKAFPESTSPALRKHKKSKDVRQKFAALAKEKYEDNQKKAEVYRRARSFGVSSPKDFQKDVAVEVAQAPVAARQAEALEADLATREVLADSWSWTLGRSLSNFKPVGRGATGEVYFATFEGQPVAVKLTRGRGLQAAARGIDVQEEFAVLAALGQHPNVVRAFAVVTSSLGRPALVLERASESLHAKARRLKHDRLETSPAGRASLLRLFSQFVLGLSFVHGRSVLHLDVKPANILVFDDVRAALADFGHAEGVSENGCSVVGERVYTLDFRCPECLMAGGQKAGLLAMLNF